MNGNAVDGEKDHLRFGSLCHTALLEGEKFRSKYIIAPEFGDLRSSKNRAVRDDWLKEHEHELIVTTNDYNRIIGIVESVLRHPKAANALTGCKTEMSGYFRDPMTGIKGRIRPDILHMDKRVLIDFKTTRDASARSFSADIAKYMYHVSLAFYGKGIKEITGWEPEVYALLAVEKEPPYAVAFYAVHTQAIATANAWVLHGMDTLKKCLETNVWPAHQEGQVEDINLPEWAHMKHLPLYDFGEND